MKVRSSVKPICEKCKVIKRKGSIRIICENPNPPVFSFFIEIITHTLYSHFNDFQMQNQFYLCYN